jgi:hypothetical protein
MNKRLQRDALLADLAAVNALLAGMSESNPLGRMSMQARRDEIEHALAQLEEAPDTVASIALLFNGDPVSGSRSVDAEFATKALEGYREIIARKLAAQPTGGPARRSPLSERNLAKLNITDVVHGLLRLSSGGRLARSASNDPISSQGGH